MAVGSVIIGALAAPGVITFSIFTGFGVSLGTFVLNVGLGLALNALQPKPKSQGANRGYQVNAMGSALDHQVVYGKARIGGAVVYDESTGANNKVFHRIIAVAGHEVESFDTIYINDEAVTIDVGTGNVTSPEQYVTSTTKRVRIVNNDNDREWQNQVVQGSLVRINLHYGTPDQPADVDLVAESEHWTDQHKLSGIAYMYVRLEFNTNAFPNGMPTITAEVKGKKVKNPSTGVTEWSENPALILRDYLTSSYGLSEDEANIDDLLVTTAATVCDQQVESPVTKMQVGGEYKIKAVGNTDWTLLAPSSAVGTIFTATLVPETGSGVVETARYTCNGAFTTALTPYDLLNDLLTSMAGSLWYSQGKWRMKPAYWTNTVMSLDEDDLRAGIDVSTRHSRRDNFNTIRGTFRGQESNWQVTDYPQVPENTGGNPNLLLTVDGGQESVADLDLPFTDNSLEARRIARITLESNRQQLTINSSFGMRAAGLQVGDNVRFTNTRFGWTNKEFQVLSWSFGLTGGLDLQVNMTLRETASSVYDDVADNLVYEKDNTTLPSPFEVPSLGINISTELRRVKGKTINALLLDITNTENILATAEVQIRKSLVEFNEPDYTSVATLGNFVGTERVEVVALEETLYDIRARATNTLGVTGEFNTISNYSVEALSAPPADVTNFDGNVVGSTLLLSWTPVTDLDLAHYIIRYSPLTSGAVHSEAEDVAEVQLGSSTVSLQNAGVGTYFIKAVDDTTSGSNTSVNPAVFVVTSVGISDLNVVATLTENPSFAGVKSNVTVNANNSLELSEDGINFDSATGLFDDATGLFDGTFSGYNLSGIYYFNSSLDLGQKYTSRLNFSFTITRLDRTDLFDTATGNFDDRSGVFDGDATAFSDTTVSMQIRHTNDDPTGTPTWTGWQSFSVSDITARAFEFRLLLSSTDTNVTPVVSALSATADMQDRVVSGSDITFTGTTNVTFGGAFSITPAIGISLANLANGDRYTITNKTRTGFTINTFTGGSASTNSVTLDYVAKGYGKELT